MSNYPTATVISTTGSTSLTVITRSTDAGPHGTRVINSTTFRREADAEWTAEENAAINAAHDEADRVAAQINREIRRELEANQLRTGMAKLAEDEAARRILARHEQ